MNENRFNQVEEAQVETNAFYRTESQEALKPKGNCHGHERSMEAGGKGHYYRDKCGCDGAPVGPSVSIDGGILPLMLVGLLMIIYKNLRKIKNNLKNLTL